MAGGAVGKLATEIGKRVTTAAKGPNQRWFGPQMAAASRAIAQRLHLPDLLLEVRDARIPLSSECELLTKFSSPGSRRIIVLNKTDLADNSQTKEWMAYFEQNSYLVYALNSHNRESVRKFLNFLQAQLREMHRATQYKDTTTIMLLGIPNVGKSAVANSLHQIGRIGAAEKGKLKHATVSPQPGETKDISSLKIGSHPNIYVLDTPGILPPKIVNAEICSKLALTGAIKDDLVGAKDLCRYFLAILNSGKEYMKWPKLPINENEKPIPLHMTEGFNNSKRALKPKRQYPTDHTQDFVVREVRRTLFETVSTFNGNMEAETDKAELIESQFISLRKAFQVQTESCEDADDKVAFKLLNLYRTGRLGHYTLDQAPVSGV